MSLSGLEHLFAKQEWCSNHRRFESCHFRCDTLFIDLHLVRFSQGAPSPKQWHRLVAWRSAHARRVSAPSSHPCMCSTSRDRSCRPEGRRHDNSGKLPTQLNIADTSEQVGLCDDARIFVTLVEHLKRRLVDRITAFCAQVDLTSSWANLDCRCLQRHAVRAYCGHPKSFSCKVPLSWYSSLFRQVCCVCSTFRSTLNKCETDVCTKCHHLSVPCEAGALVV